MKIDPEIARRVKAVVENCKIEVPTWQIWDCKGDVRDQIVSYAVKDKVVGVYEMLAEMALTDGAKDKRLLVAIADSWPHFRDRAFQIQASTPAAAERVIALYARATGSERFPEAAVPLAAGKHAELSAALGKLPASSKLRHAAISAYLDWGGSTRLSDVQTFYAKASDDGERYAAAWAVGNAIGDNLDRAMGKPELAGADKTKLCDWVKGIATDAAATTGAVAGAVASLGRCQGAYIDDALTALEGQLANGKLTADLTTALHHMCWGGVVTGGTINGTKAQCARAFDLLATGVAGKDVPPGVLRTALWTAGALAQNEPGLGARTKQLLAKFTGHADKDVADQARDGIKEIH
ncbi:MAG: hypothetical protein ABI867_17895 [Kofleriaceae bacterium]